MSATSATLAPAIAHRFHELEMRPLLTVDRVTRCPQWAEVENRTRRSTSDLTNPLLRRGRSGMAVVENGQHLWHQRWRQYCRVAGGGGAGGRGRRLGAPRPAGARVGRAGARAA